MEKAYRAVTQRFHDVGALCSKHPRQGCELGKEANVDRLQRASQAENPQGELCILVTCKGALLNRRAGPVR
jgi:hypothetical protein